MNEQVRLLQTEIRAGLQAIDQAYGELHRFSDRLAEPEMAIVVAYYLHVIYGLFENLFSALSGTFRCDQQDGHS